jgi:hypothetical protein
MGIGQMDENYTGHEFLSLKEGKIENTETVGPTTVSLLTQLQ